MVERERERERLLAGNASKTGGEWRDVCCLIPQLPASDFAHALNFFVLFEHKCQTGTVRILGISQN